MTDPKIVKAQNVKGGEWDPVKIFVTYEGDSEMKYLRSFFDDEIYVDPSKLIGMTEQEARNHIHELDVMYLRS